MRAGRIVVAGATGYLGGHVVEALTSRGWQVRALAREGSSAAKREQLEAMGAEIFLGQATDAASLAGLFDDCSAAFSSIGIRSFHRRPSYREVDLGANMNLVDAAEAAGVERFAFVSVLGGPDVRARSPLVDARERVADRLAESSMRSLILRPTGFFNDLGDYFQMAKRGKVWLIGDGETRINPIHGADLAAAAADALGEAVLPASRELGGPDTLTQREIGELAFGVLGKPAKFGRVPAGVVRGAAALLSPFNGNASALLKMFSMLGDRDAVGEPVGRHRLVDHFRSLV